MSFPERRKKILALLQKAGSLSVADIALKLSISPATVRRDLVDLDKEGVLLRTHGGAMKAEGQALTGFHQKQNANESVKQAIGKLAADYVRDGDTIFMDCGSTVFCMCPYLKKISRLKIITNSLPIVAELMDVPGISLNLVGGELDKDRRAIHGDMAIQHIDTYHAGKAFIGIDGIPPEGGLSSHSEKEARITKAWCRNAAEVFLLCDASKIGKDAYIKLGPLSMIHWLVTGTGLSSMLKESIAAHGVNVLTAE